MSEIKNLKQVVSKGGLHPKVKAAQNANINAMASNWRISARNDLLWGISEWSAQETLRLTNQRLKEIWRNR